MLDDTVPGQPLVTVEWLADQLASGDRDLVVLDCRWYLRPFDERDGEAEYRAGHIPGARYLAWDREIADPARGSLNMLADGDRFSEAMGRLGIGDSTMVVTYDDHHVPVAARVWWALQVYGHEAAAVLDGGITRWRAEGHRVASGAPPAACDPPARFTARFDRSLYATKADVVSVVAAPAPIAAAGDVAHPRPAASEADPARGESDSTADSAEESTRGECSPVRIVDARMGVAYAAASGHIPGSVRVTGLGFLVDGERWMTPEQCRARILEADPTLADATRTILTCGGGVAATGALLAFKMAGVGGELSVYDGSWSEWDTDPDTPKERH